VPIHSSSRGCFDLEKEEKEGKEVKGPLYSYLRLHDSEKEERSGGVLKKGEWIKLSSLITKGPPKKGSGNIVSSMLARRRGERAKEGRGVIFDLCRDYYGGGKERILVDLYHFKNA